MVMRVDRQDDTRFTPVWLSAYCTMNTFVDCAFVVSQCIGSGQWISRLSG